MRLRFSTLTKGSAEYSRTNCFTWLVSDVRPGAGMDDELVAELSVSGVRRRGFGRSVPKPLPRCHGPSFSNSFSTDGGQPAEAGGTGRSTARAAKELMCANGATSQNERVSQ